MTAFRNLRAIASASFPAREHYAEIARGQRSPLSVDFNGVLDKGVTLTGATWWCWAPWGLQMADATFGERSSAVTITGGWGSETLVRCKATASDGSIVVQDFVVRVKQRRWWLGEQFPSTSGPQSIEAVPA